MKHQKVEWTKQKTAKSAFFFVLHFILLIAIIGVMLFWGKFETLEGEMADRGADYLYTLFCIFLMCKVFCRNSLLKNQDRK